MLVFGLKQFAKGARVVCVIYAYKFLNAPLFHCFVSILLA